VNIGSVYSIACDWLGRACVHLDITPPNGFQDSSGIVRCLVERSIPMNGAHAEELDAGIVCTDEQGKGILGQP
jgi:hypothetical protein